MVVFDIKAVVVRDFFAFVDVSDGSDIDVSISDVDLAVGIAGVVDVFGDVCYAIGVDCPVIVKFKEVDSSFCGVFFVLFKVCVFASFAFCGADFFAGVFDDDCAFGDGVCRKGAV